MELPVLVSCNKDKLLLSKAGIKNQKLNEDIARGHPTG